MTQKLLIIVITAFFNAAYLAVIDFLPSADHDVYLYGKVYTDNDEVYEGQIRWGKEEAFWFDFFNSNKPENEYLDYLAKDDLKQLNKDHEDYVSKGLFNWNKNWGNKDHTHAFQCQFGNIKSIELGHRERVKVVLKNDDVIHLKGGSNDIGTYVQVNDSEVGHIKLDWDRLEKVEFMNAPSSFNSYYGLPLYGTVLTYSGESFTGYVQWDHDERMAHDELNGKSRDGELDIEFGNIQKIEKKSRGSRVTLASGRELDLRGTNDVNDDNRGIIVNIPGQGRVDIPWDEFEEVTFTDPKLGVVSYDDFDGHEKIYGTVQTEDGQSYTGHLAFDLDETYQLEILNGSKDDIEYFLPFSTLKKLTAQNRRRTLVTLKSGKTLELEDSVDVNADNDGILVFSDDQSDPVYIRWRDVEEINL